jgi:hypothetical protein
LEDASGAAVSISSTKIGSVIFVFSVSKVASVNFVSSASKGFTWWALKAQLQFQIVVSKF